MEDVKKNKRSKRTYKKPTIRIIKLVHGQEVLGIGCKTDIQANPSAGPPCDFANCQFIGT